jgi:MoaA/NifB/PqqE/SkfB family radical SAM enzyme
MKKKAHKAKSETASRKPYYELLSNLLFDFASIRLRLKLFRPLITNIYITKRCNLRCRYCYPPGDEKDMDPRLGLILLEKIRPQNPAINFTGGEPLLHPHLPTFLEKARELRFRPIILSTNAHQIDNLTNLLPMIDNLIISLDSTDEKINDTLSGVPGSTRTVMNNIETLAGLRKYHKFNISLHAVLCESNLKGMEELVAFCDLLNITLSISPEHIEAYPSGNLINNVQYTSAIQRLKQLKREGKPIACSIRYLNKIEQFSEHKCFPFFSPRIEPDGTVYFPCYRIRERSYNLKDYKSLYTLMREKGEWMERYCDCSKRCFLACYMEVERYVENPLSLLTEIPFRNLALGHSLKLADEKSYIEGLEKDG